jgi:hypothetical protein
MFDSRIRNNEAETKEIQTNQINVFYSTYKDEHELLLDSRIRNDTLLYDCLYLYMKI